MNKKIKKAFISIDNDDIRNQISEKLIDAGVSISQKTKLEDILKCDLCVIALNEFNYELDQDDLISNIETERLNIIRESAKKYKDILIIYKNSLIFIYSFFFCSKMLISTEILETSSIKELNLDISNVEFLVSM
jgi:hypothetical protein